MMQLLTNALRAIELGGDEARAPHGGNVAKMVAERDLSSIETARLMEKLLRSVPLTDYETLRIKYDALLKTDAFGPSAAATTTVTEQPLISLITTHQREEYDELLARNAYLKKMLEILTDQNEFWSRECDILQLENEEIKRFLEDMENRSDQREILGEIERRLLQTIREQAEEAMERDSDKRRGNEHFNRFEKAQGQWQAQKRHLMHAVQLLQTTLQAENQDPNRVKRALSGALLEVGQLREQQRISQALTQKLEADLSKKTLECEELNKVVKEHVEALISWDVWREFDSEEKPKRVAKIEKIEKETSPEAEEGYQEDYESESTTDSGADSEAGPKVIVRTIVKDNRKPFEEQFARMKKATQICIQTYKEQLAQREEAIEHYKKLLKERMEEPPREERVRRLTTANKDLLATCEKIRDDALQELEAKRNRLATQGDAETTRLRTECERLRRETRALQRTVAIQNETIRNTQNSEERKNATEEVAKWHEKKKAEQTIVILKKRLKTS
ncbi:unnamed protein product, partial [Mesorhabditis spiculigera]